MKKFIIFFTLSLFCHTAFSQQRGYFFTINTNMYSCKEEGGRLISSFDSKPGFSLGVVFDSVTVGHLNLKFAFRAENYATSFFIKNGGGGGGNEVSGDSRKTTLGFTFMPVKINLGRAQINVGPDVSFLLWESLSGYSESWRLGSAPHTEELESINNFSPRFVAGLRAGIEYGLPTKNLIVKPKYGFYYGLTNEIQNSHPRVHSVRHELGMIFMRK